MLIHTLDGFLLETLELKIIPSSKEVDEIIFDMPSDLNLTGTSPATMQYAMLFGRKRRERREKQSDERRELLSLTTFSKEEVPDFPSLIAHLSTPEFKEYLDARKSSQLPFNDWEDFFEISQGKSFYSLLDEHLVSEVSPDFINRMIMNGFALNMNFPDFPLSQAQLLQMMDTINGIYDGYLDPALFGLRSREGVHELHNSVHILRQLAASLANVSYRCELLSALHRPLSSSLRSPLLRTSIVLQELNNTIRFQLDEAKNEYNENSKNIHYGPRRKIDSLLVDYGFWYVREHYEAYLKHLQGRENEYAPARKVYVCGMTVQCNSLMLQALLEDAGKSVMTIETLKKNMEYIALTNQSYAAYSMYDTLHKKSNFLDITEAPEIYMYSLKVKCTGHRNNFYKYLHLLRKEIYR